LGEGYKESELRKIFEDVNFRNENPMPRKEFDMLIDIQKTISEVKDKDYWDKIYNSELLAQTLLFL